MNFNENKEDIQQKETTDKKTNSVEEVLQKIFEIMQSIQILEQKFNKLLKRYQQLNVRIRFLYRSLVNLVKNLFGKQLNKNEVIDKFLHQLFTLQINAENLLKQLQELRGMLSQINTEVASISEKLNEEDLEYIRLQFSIVENKLNRLEQLIQDFINRLVKKSNKDVLSLGKKLTSLRKIKRRIFFARKIMSLIMPFLPIIFVVLFVCCLIFVGILIIQKLHETFPPFLVDLVVQNAENLF